MSGVAATNEWGSVLFTFSYAKIEKVGEFLLSTSHIEAEFELLHLQARVSGIYSVPRIQAERATPAVPIPCHLTPLVLVKWFRYLRSGLQGPRYYHGSGRGPQEDSFGG